MQKSLAITYNFHLQKGKLVIELYSESFVYCAKHHPQESKLNSIQLEKFFEKVLEKK